MECRRCGRVRRPGPYYRVRVESRQYVLCMACAADVLTYATKKYGWQSVSAERLDCAPRETLKINWRKEGF
jgi:RNase P subunit RPR2